MKNVNSLNVGDTVLIKCKVVAVFTGSQMAMVTTRDCDKGFDAYTDEILGKINCNEDIIDNINLNLVIE